MTTAPHILSERKQHHAALEALARDVNPDNTANGLQLWRRLARIERVANAAACHYCNGKTCRHNGEEFHFESDENAWDRFHEVIEGEVAKVFGGQCPPGFFVNGDARGYALKLQPGSTRHALHCDWGGYQILAPTIE